MKGYWIGLKCSFSDLTGKMYINCSAGGKTGFFLVIITLVDGNKRIGMLAMLVFLGINGVEIKCTDDGLIARLIGGQSVSNEDLLGWIIDHS